MPENLRFTSMEELASAHSELLTQYTAERAAEFVKRAMRTGAILETAGDRRGDQARIDYWTTLLLRSESAKTIRRMFGMLSHTGSGPTESVTPEKERGKRRSIMMPAAADGDSQDRLINGDGPSREAVF